jgi:two-component system chemotaxis sensor kinase CheA
MDMSQYKSLFLGEAREYLHTINEMVAALKVSPKDRSAIDALFRGAHSLKGMAASMDFGDIVKIAHNMEGVMIRVREETLGFETGVADLIFESADLIEGLLDDLEKELEPRRPLGDLPERLLLPTSMKRESISPGEPPSSPKGASPEVAPRCKGDEITTVRVRTEVLDHLVNLTGELITNKERLLNVGRQLDSVSLNEAISQSAKLLRALHDEVMKVRLMPFEAICDQLRRSVRTVAKKSGKDLNFEIEGSEIGLDRGILERLADPLNHLLRNAVDHGIEYGEERLAAGKPAKGKVWLSLSQELDRILITVKDDGRGMEPQLMIAAAIAKGLLTPEEAELLTPHQALMLACIPGFSTAAVMTDVSGRGVGMDAVSASIQKLGGALAIESEPGKGSSFNLRLPMTIAIIHALIVQCGALKVAVPVSSVQRSIELRKEEVETLSGRRAFHFEGESLPLLSLNRLLGLPPSHLQGGFMSLFVTEVKERRVGLVVDRLLGQQELFVKPLGRPLSKIPGVAGGATLGDGEIITILNLAQIL